MNLKKTIFPSIFICLVLIFFSTVSALSKPAVRGDELYLDDEPFTVKGIYYSPWRPGTGPGKHYPYPEKSLLAEDFEKLDDLNTNMIYVLESTVDVLDLAEKHEIYVLYGFWLDWWNILDPDYIQEKTKEILYTVEKFKNHPALFGWVLGNEVPEYEYKAQGPEIAEQLKTLYEKIKEIDPDNIITHSNWPITKGMDLSFLDIISFNVYPLWPQEVVAIGYERYIREVLNPIAEGKPLLITEFGINTIEVTEREQARILKECWEAILNSPAVGGFVFAFSDEWWKNYDTPVTPGDWWVREFDPEAELTHDLDPEEHYGIIRDFEEPKPAYYTVREMFREEEENDVRYLFIIFSIGLIVLFIVLFLGRIIWGSRKDDKAQSLKKGFTLIELLVVVAIIGILAAVGLYNFLNAQVRARVSRVKADFATITTALESYYVDYNAYPPSFDDNKFIGQLPTEVPVSGRLYPLTTPTAYLSSVPPDPFGFPEPTVHIGALRYGYDYVDAFSIPPEIFEEGDTRGAVWRIASPGPNQEHTFGVIRFGGVDYDPTNGVISKGDIVRTGALIKNFDHEPPSP